jgi:superoxide dismutase
MSKKAFKWGSINLSSISKTINCSKETVQAHHDDHHQEHLIGACNLLELWNLRMTLATIARTWLMDMGVMHLRQAKNLIP